MNQNSTPQQNGSNVSAAMSWVLFIAQSFAVTIEVFLHEPGSFGRRYMGTQVLVGAGILVVFPGFYPQHDSEPLFLLLCAFLLMCVIVRVAVLRRVARGDEEHSRYNGRPRPLGIGRPMNELFVKSSLEPALVIMAGVILLEINEPMGMYLLIAGVSLGISVNVPLGMERARARDMHDAYLEQRNTMDQWQKFRNR